MPDIDIDVLPLLPLTTGVVLPGMVVTLTLESDEARAAAEAASDTAERTMLLVPKVDGRYARVGTIAKIEDLGQTRSGVEALVIRGLSRAVVGVGVPGTGEALWVQAEPVEEPEPTARAKELAREYRAVVENIVESRGVPQVAEFLRGIADPGQIADTAGYSPDLSFEQKIEILETVEVEARLELVVGWAKDTLADLELKDKIRTDVSEGMEKRQREFLLREQMSAIRKELGEDGEEDVVGEYRQKIADAGMPDDVLEQAEKELGRLERMSEQSPEYGWIRTYLDWLIDVPWNVRTDDNLEIAEARAVLDADHEGLQDVKDRILEYLAVRKLRAERGLGEATGRGSGAILTLVGPPGVGKTSLGESVARALGRKFVRVSLGGIHDEAEIRGHRRTYVGALPGRIVRALKDAGSKNPVMMLDEIDKVGADWRGDPSSALLEVLDPAQNHTFRDHYLDVDLDLSEVLFITTANVAETIPGPLFDRMEVIRIDGYTEEEKVAIAKHHLVARQRERNGLREDEVVFTDDALRVIVGDYTREAGVRNLERELGKALRKVATTIAAGDAETPRHDRRRRRPHLPGTPEVLLRGGRPHGGARRGDRPRGHRRGRRRAVHRGEPRGRRRAEGRADPHRPAGRRDEGVGADRAQLRALARRRAGDRARAAAWPVPRARARGRGAEGRSERRCHDDHRVGVAAHRHAGALRGGHDRRGHVAGPGAADRRAEAEGAGRPPGRSHRGDPAQAQRR